MPELPEVETVRRGLEQKLNNFIIKKVEVCRDSTVAFPTNKDEFIKDVFISTTGWLVKDNSLNDLLNLINEKYDVNLLGLASPLNFKSSIYKELKDYEMGHVKEGVGAGGISLLAYLNGFKNDEIVSLCQQNLEMMKSLGQISLEKDC